MISACTQTVTLWSAAKLKINLIIINVYISWNCISRVLMGSQNLYLKKKSRFVGFLKRKSFQFAAGSMPLSSEACSSSDNHNLIMQIWRWGKTMKGRCRWLFVFNISPSRWSLCQFTIFCGPALIYEIPPAFIASRAKIPPLVKHTAYSVAPSFRLSVWTRGRVRKSRVIHKRKCKFLWISSW